MSVQRVEKQTEIDLVRDRFMRATSAVLVDFTGVSVAAVTHLRVKFRNAGVEYRVVKNTLIKQALKETKYADNKELGQFLVGATGIAWSYEDPSAAAKVLRDVKKADPDATKWRMGRGVLDTQILGEKRVELELAALPGKDEVRASLLAQLLAPAQSLVRQLAAPAQNFAYVLSAYERKQG